MQQWPLGFTVERNAMVDTAACSPCNFEALLALPSPGDELLSLGLPSIASPHAPHAAGQVQPAEEQRTPDATSLNFIISDEEMQWLVALTDEDGIAPDAAAAAASAAAAQPLATSAAMAAAAAPLPQQEQPMQLLDQRLLHSAASMPDLSSASAASAAADVINNACWAVELEPRHAVAAGGNLIAIEELHICSCLTSCIWLPLRWGWTSLSNAEV